MINFRFHIVSLIAVFLALGLGILVGSTVVDQKIVDRLDSEISHVRHDNDARKAANKALSQENSQLRKFIDQTAPFVGDGRLDQQPIAIVAERGVDTGVVKQVEQSLQAAGANVPAVLWLDEPWLLNTEERLHALQSALDLQGSGPAMRDAAFAALARRLANAPVTSPSRASTSSSTTRTVTPPSSPTSVPRVDALAALEQAGFLDVTDGQASAFNAFPPRVAADVLVITGDDSHFLGSDMTSAFVRALVSAKVPTVVGAVYDAGTNLADAPERGAALAPVLDDKSLSRAASTVDDLEMMQGRVAAVLALEIVRSGSVGHYGYGANASAPIPPHPSS
jgi:hypothetical protein